MAFNPMKLMELKNLRDRFAQNHPKFVKFMSDLASSQIEEGTILEVTVKKPDGRTMVSNIKVTASDLEMLQAADLAGQMHLLTKLFERNHGFLPLLRCIPDDRSSVLLPARPSRRLPHLDSEYAERTRTVYRMHDRACDASCCYRLAVTLLRLHCRLHRKPACLVRCNCTADSSLLSDDDEACKNSVIKIGPPDIDMPGNAKPGILSLLF